MPKPSSRIYSRHAREAATLLGLMIHNARVERGQTIAEVAERAGVTRGLASRVEKGDMGCSIGVVFEVAQIVGVRLFDAEPETLTSHLALARDKLALLPKAVRQVRKAVKDDF
jgi:transcriptional regulator with XRE-family HTH domain